MQHGSKRVKCSHGCQKNADAEKNKAEADQEAAEKTEAQKQADDAKEEAEKTEIIPENRDTADDADALKDPPKPEDHPVQDLADTEANQAPDPLQKAPIPTPENTQTTNETHEEEDDEEEGGFPENIPKSDSLDNPNDSVANDGDPESEDLDKKEQKQTDTPPI